MNCVRLDEIYRFLDGDLSPAEKSAVEGHLAVCSRCREALEERRILAEAADGLPTLQVPADFSRRVMDKIAARKVSLPAWLIALVSGASVLAVLAAIALFSGRGALSLLASFNHSLWNGAKSAAVFSAKLLRLVSLAGALLKPLVQVFSRGFSVLMTLIGPGLQVILIMFSLVLVISLFYGLRKIFSMGESR
jgi:anti-sigma factor RsiW